MSVRQLGTGEDQKFIVTIDVSNADLKAVNYFNDTTSGLLSTDSGTTFSSNKFVDTTTDVGALKKFLESISSTETEGGILRSFAIKIGEDGSYSYNDTKFVDDLNKFIGFGSDTTKGINYNNGATAGTPKATDQDPNFVLQLLESIQASTKGAIFDLNTMAELAAAPADKYALALEELRSLGEESSIGIAELTQKTTDVQVESGKLEMVNGVIKNAVNYLNGRARALTS